MEHASEQAVGFWTPRPPSSSGVLSRLESLSHTLNSDCNMTGTGALKSYLGRGMDAVTHIGYRNPDSLPYLYAVAV